MQANPTISEIIKQAGGPAVIERESGGEINAGAVYKWSKIGIPDRHWPIIIKLSGASADELLAANVQARSPEAPANSQPIEAGP